MPQLPRRLVLLACLVAAVLIACLPHASGESLPAGSHDAGRSAVGAHAGVGQQGAAQHLAAPPQGEAARAHDGVVATAAQGCAERCADQTAAAAIACVMAAVATLGALSLLRRRPVLSPPLRSLRAGAVRVLTPAPPRPPSLVALGISRT
ncbi:hypothetical protein [Zhihengliuella flava]|uniref:Uncharacterized protein n=1 Tax=Zhihengliuella flava TaxID=1285193 RepID=A0A931D9L3_9MICC|nr:hypothetical protein [Zhihengliuella flava]MBG6084507.1 hypothetical protein [Zhihengliuella flava]